MNKKVVEISENSLKIINDWYLDQKALIDFGEAVDYKLYMCFLEIIRNKYITEEQMSYISEYLYTVINQNDEDVIAERSREEALKISRDLDILDILTN